jgi:hypothetical protein
LLRFAFSFVIVNMMKKNTLPVLLLAVFPLLLSCTARISGSLLGDGQADLTVYAGLEPRMAALIARISEFSGTAQPGAPVLDGPALSASMSDAPGIASVSLWNRTPATVEGPVRISRIGDFLSRGGAAGFITFEQNTSGGRCTVRIGLDSGPQILSLISPDVVDYLGALMAPIATGEPMTKAEYLALVGSVYGRGITDEISAATVRAVIDFPGPVQSAQGGTFSGRRAEFVIPLLDILVLETPLSYEIRWR